jgi:hypothetical protein
MTPATTFEPADLAFDAATHAYAYRGDPLLGVTETLHTANLIDAMWFTDGSADRGTRVHAAIAGRLRGARTAHEDLAGYLTAFDAFIAESGFHVHASEEVVCDPFMRCAGTLDLRGSFDPALRVVDLIDIKTGTLPKWVGYQVAGYARLLAGRNYPRIRRWALHLRASGRFTLVPLVNRNDDAVFLAALTIACARRGWL